MPIQQSAALGQAADQQHSQKHRHGVVAARLDLERRAHPLLEIHAPRVQYRKHRRGIRGTDDRAQQQSLHPVQVQQPGGEQAGDHAGQHYPQCCQGHSGIKADAECLGTGAHAAVQQDDGQRHGPDHIGQRHIVELDATDTFLAGQHAENQKHQQQRCAQARRRRTGKNTAEQQHGADQDDMIEKLHGTDSAAGKVRSSISVRAPRSQGLTESHARRHYRVQPVAGYLEPRPG